jgi:hypothetical protein
MIRRRIGDASVEFRSSLSCVCTVRPQSLRAARSVRPAEHSAASRAGRTRLRNSRHMHSRPERKRPPDQGGQSLQGINRIHLKGIWHQTNRYNRSGVPQTLAGIGDRAYWQKVHPVLDFERWWPITREKAPTGSVGASSLPHAGGGGHSRQQCVTPDRHCDCDGRHRNPFLYDRKFRQQAAETQCLFARRLSWEKTR